MTSTNPIGLPVMVEALVLGEYGVEGGVALALDGLPVEAEQVVEVTLADCGRVGE